MGLPGVWISPVLWCCACYALTDLSLRDEACADDCFCDEREPEFMDCSNRKLTDYPYSYRAEYPSIERIDLSANDLTRNPLHAFRHNFPNLRKINLSSNRLPCGPLMLMMSDGITIESKECGESPVHE